MAYACLYYLDAVEDPIDVNVDAECEFVRFVMRPKSLFNSLLHLLFQQNVTNAAGESFEPRQSFHGDRSEV